MSVTEMAPRWSSFCCWNLSGLGSLRPT
uniref:Uncharacterized protein n=1 Tax=Anguilla anguilla TaxID=7936 RepID=A0A0E9RXR4_ANGAN